MYEWLKALHVLTAFGFILAHGASVLVALRMREERDPARLAALLDLSRGSLGPVTWVVALLMLVTGIALGFLASWWSAWWIWAGVALFVIVAGAMTPLGSYRLNDIRRALGMPVMKEPTRTPLPAAELVALLERYDPRPVTWIGGVGLAAIVLLMVLKPY